MNNPFINTSITLTHIDERDNDNIELDQSNIINYYNTLPDISHQLVEADVKVVLKGGLNIRLYLWMFLYKNVNRYSNLFFQKRV